MEISHFFLFLAISFSCIQGQWCFFLRHSSGWCVRTAPSAFLSKGRMKAWYLELTNRCADVTSQFRFHDNGVLDHVSSTGCVLPLNGKLNPSDGTNLVVLNGKRDCVNETRQGYVQTIYGSLRHFSGKCVQPHTSFQSVPSAGAKLEYTSTCNTTKQNFVLGSVTCQGKKTADINCPSSQVIVVTLANYGGYGHMTTCNYNRIYNCKLPSSLCQLKRKCDGLQACEINVTTSEFNDDPCPGVSKYLYLEYKCVNKTMFKDNNIYVSDIRLVSQTSPGEGYIEVVENSKPNIWQRLCVRNWAKSEKQLMCRSLGYSGVKDEVFVMTPSGPSFKNRINVDMYCHGNANNVSSCCFQKVIGGQDLCLEKMTLLACSICSEPMLSGNNHSAVITFTASNSIPWHTADQAVISSNRSWCGVRSGDYLELDLSEKYVIAQLSTFGDQSRGQFVTSYEVLFAEEKNKWTPGMVEGNKVFTTNSESNKKLSSIIFTSPITARFLKILPKTWHGQPCMRLEICGHKLLPDPPRNLTISRVSAITAHFSWEEPKGSGDGFFTDYRILLSSAGEVLVSNTTTNKYYFLKRLRPFTEYTISVQAGNTHGYGRKVERTFKTDSAVPSGPPTKIQVRAASATSLIIKWDQPLSHHLNGVLKGYEVCITRVPSSNQCDRIVRTLQSEIPVSDLRRAEKYKTKILVRNDAGAGNYSLDYFQITNAEAPVCNFSSITGETFTVKLQKPRKEVSVCQLLVSALAEDDLVPETSSKEPLTYLEASDSSTPVLYVAAEFAATDFYKYKEFTLGDGRVFPVSLKITRKNAAVKKYFNGPLSPNTKYTVVQRFYSNGSLLYSSDFLPPVKTLGGTSSAEKRKDSDSSHFKVAFIIAAVCLAIMLLIVIYLTLNQRRQRSAGQNAKEHTTPPEQIPMNPTITNSNEQTTNF